MTRISIITASYNYEEYIGETIESVINQTFEDWEMIIVDDGSSDNSLEVIKKYCEKDSRIKLFQHENGANKGLCETVKLGIKKAQAEWIVFLESDDTLTPDYLEAKLDVAKNYPEVEFIFNDVKMFGDEKVIAKLGRYFEHTKMVLDNKSYPADLKKYFNKRNLIPTFSVVMVKKELIEKIDFNVEFNPWLDWYLWSQIARNNKLYYLDKKLSNWRMHKNSYISAQPTELQRHRFKRQIYNALNSSNFIIELFAFLKFIRRQIFRVNFKKKIICFMGKWYCFGNKKEKNVL